MAYAYVGPGGRRPFLAPTPVKAARILLWVQASIWAMVAMTSSYYGVINLFDQDGLGNVHHLVFWCAWTGSVTFFALGSFGLALGLKPGKNGIRRTVIGLECFMTCFGTVVAFPALRVIVLAPRWGILLTPVFLAAFIGAVVSCASVGWLLCRPAREYARAKPTYQ
ncbi:hypothetical protein AB0L00_02865 [Actinoallomurus sp. NPDC052308]|uniref:hypothetical protein n=1 Tax=Actinoallomurus sp. NPDC052308 TaxID=3155530 RepID=UPI003431C979